MVLILVYKCICRVYPLKRHQLPSNPVSVHSFSFCCLKELSKELAVVMPPTPPLTAPEWKSTDKGMVNVPIKSSLKTGMRVQEEFKPFLSPVPNKKVGIHY